MWCCEIPPSSSWEENMHVCSEPCLPFPECVCFLSCFLTGKKRGGLSRRAVPPSRHFHRCRGEDGCTAAAAADVQRWSSASLLGGPEECLQWTLPVPEDRSGPGSGDAPLSRRSPTTFCLSQKPFDVGHPGTLHQFYISLQEWSLFTGCRFSCSQGSAWRSCITTSTSRPPLVPKGRRMSRGAATGTTGWESAFFCRRAWTEFLLELVLFCLCAFMQPLMDCAVCYKTLREDIEPEPKPYVHCIHKTVLTQVRPRSWPLSQVVHIFTFF